MLSKENSFESIHQEFIKNNLELTALIQDIQKCSGPLEVLNSLNADGRSRIASLKENITILLDLANRERSKKKKSEFLIQVDNCKGQFATAYKAFCKANIECLNIIDKISRESLLEMPNNQENSAIKRRFKQDAANMSSSITEQLRAVSKHLAETTQRGVETLDSLITSSDKAISTRKELEHQHQVIAQSGKLLGKYSRREITDKALLFLAFMFFLACVFYILQKRLF